MYLGHFLKSEALVDPATFCCCVLTAWLGLAVSTATPAWPDQQQPDRTTAVSFDIAAQPLEMALDAYGSESGVQVLYQTSMTAGRRSARIRGWFTPEAALKALLAGTGLTPRFTTDDSYTLMEPPRVATSSPGSSPSVPPDMARYGQFLGIAQADILNDLCRQPQTRPGSYRIGLKLWIDVVGKMQKTTLIQSSGNAKRDGAIMDALDRLQLETEPPVDMPQPITMIISDRPSDQTGDCASVARSDRANQ